MYWNKIKYRVLQLDARSELRNMIDRTPGVTEVGPALFSQPKVRAIPHYLRKKYFITCSF